MKLLSFWVLEPAKGFGTIGHDAARDGRSRTADRGEYVGLLKDSGFETRMGDVRSSARLNSRVAVAVEWRDAGQSLRAEGYTVDIGAKGCLAIVPQGFAVGQKLRLVNLINQISCEAVLVWRGHEGRTGWELGLELQEPTPDFWGLDF
jgi:hypothetical protein